MHQRHRQTSTQSDQDEQCAMGWLEGSVSSGRSKLGEGQQRPGPQLELKRPRRHGHCRVQTGTAARPSDTCRVVRNRTQPRGRGSALAQNHLGRHRARGPSAAGRGMFKLRRQGWEDKQRCWERHELRGRPGRHTGSPRPAWPPPRAGQAQEGDHPALQRDCWHGYWTALWWPSGEGPLTARAELALQSSRTSEPGLSRQQHHKGLARPAVPATRGGHEGRRKRACWGPYPHSGPAPFVSEDQEGTTGRSQDAG